MVFQNYALYPYLTVEANIAFPLKIAKVKKSERERRVRDVAELLGLTEFLQRKPGQLSGGQRQRVAMGRAIVREPSVFLMDEPLSNLDAKLRVQMRADIAALQSRLGVTTVYVTHDQSEAMTLGHRVAVLKDGQLQQCAPPRTLYERPVNTFVAGFIGSPAMNLCELPLGTNGSVPFGGETVALPAAVAGSGWSRIVLGLRPESLELAGDGIPARVEVVEEIGADAYVFCVADVAGAEIKLVARCETRQSPDARCARPPAPARARGARLRSGHRREDPGLMSGEVMLGEIREQPRALVRLLEQERELETVASGTGAARTERRSPGRSRHVRQRGLVRRLRIRTAARLDGAARLDLADRLLRRRRSTSAARRSIALSQSGRTPDVVEYVARARAGGALTIALTNDPASELGEAAELVLPLAAGPERAVAATKTYLNELAALALLAAGAVGRGRRWPRASVASLLCSPSASPPSRPRSRRSPRRVRSSGGCS